MADHVGVCVIQNKKVILARGEFFDHEIGDAFGAHFGLQIVGGDFWRGDHLAVFARIRGFDAAVEEVGNVRIFFRFGEAELRHAALAEDLGKDVVHALRRKNNFHTKRVVLYVVLCECGIFDRRVMATVEVVEVFFKPSAAELAGAVGAKVEK